MNIFLLRINQFRLSILLGWNSLERLPKDSQHNDETIYIQNGFLNFLQKAFVDKISEDKIELNTIVKRICVNEEEQYIDIQILKNNQELITYQAKHVVCTQSIGCLKQSMHQIFIPPLPHAKRMSIQKLGFGTINKVC
jgi:protoporphyrinogen oxidase